MKKQILLFLCALMILAVLMTACGSESSESEAVSFDGSQNSVAVNSAIESSEASSEESVPDEELSVVGTWRVITDVSPWVKLRLNAVCPEMKIDGAKLKLPVIVEIDEECVTV